MTNYEIPTVASIKAALDRDGPRFRAISLFAGGGGSSCGYRMAGGQILGINEFIPEAISTYKANWPDSSCFEGDIRAISGKDILTYWGIERGELELLDGSPPCSAFSTAGKRDKGWGKTKAYSDSKQSNVEDLFFEYIRILDAVQPRVFVAENVAGLAKGVAKGYLNDILRNLRACGYHVECKILDAKWLGVPQSRPRTIFVGIRNDLFKEEMRGKLHPKPKKQFVKLKDALKGLKFTDEDAKQTDIKKYSIYPLLVNLKKGATHPKRFNLYKANPEGPCYCITATTGTIGAANVCHWENRAFTVSEVKRIMSVPDDYILTGTYKQKVERLGRMVAPFMMKAVSENILSLGVLNGDT